jgi:hypothetical protein
MVILDFKENKRGSANAIAWPEITYLILFLVFAFILLVFAKNSIGGASINEEIYAKKIALIIDGARPGTDITLDVTDAYNIALKEKRDVVRAKGESFSKVKDEPCIFVSLGSKTGGYTYCYFSNYNILFSPPNLGNNGRVTIKIEVKE